MKGQCQCVFQVNSCLTEDNILPGFLEHSLQPRSWTQGTSTHLTQVTGTQQLRPWSSQPPALRFISALMGLCQVTRRNSNDSTSCTQGPPSLHPLRINHQPCYQRNYNPSRMVAFPPLNLPLFIQKLHQ